MKRFSRVTIRATWRPSKRSSSAIAGRSSHLSSVRCATPRWPRSSIRRSFCAWSSGPTPFGASRNSRRGSSPSPGTSASTTAGRCRTGGTVRTMPPRAPATKGRPRSSNGWPVRPPARIAPSIGRELGARIASAVEALPDEQRAVFLLRQVHDLPFKEVAAVCGVPENTVKSRMRYALERLQEALSDYEDYAEEVK